MSDRRKLAVDRLAAAHLGMYDPGTAIRAARAVHISWGKIAAVLDISEAEARSYDARHPR